MRDPVTRIDRADSCGVFFSLWPDPTFFFFFKDPDTSSARDDPRGAFFLAAAEEGRVEAAGRLLLDGCTDVVEEGVVEGGVVEEGVVEEGVVE